MSSLRKLARGVAHRQMKRAGSHVNSKRQGKSPFSQHWRVYAPGKYHREEG